MSSTLLYPLFQVVGSALLPGTTFFFPRGLTIPSFAFTTVLILCYIMGEGDAADSKPVAVTLLTQLLTPSLNSGQS